MNVLATIIIAGVSLLFVSMAIVPLLVNDGQKESQGSLRSQFRLIEGGKEKDHLEIA